MCGETMRLVEREQTERLPGRTEISRRKIREWVCPGCDYFEEASGDSPEG